MFHNVFLFNWTDFIVLCHFYILGVWKKEAYDLVALISKKSGIAQAQIAGYVGERVYVHIYYAFEKYVSILVMLMHRQIYFFKFYTLLLYIYIIFSK